MTAVRKEEETKEMGKIIGICISEKRGTAKHEVETAKLVEDWGIEGDAHAGHWHRQVSLLSYEKIEAFRAKGADIPLGAFGENLIVETACTAGRGTGHGSCLYHRRGRLHSAHDGRLYAGRPGRTDFRNYRRRKPGISGGSACAGAGAGEEK